jgi:hypothetical protein
MNSLRKIGVAVFLGLCLVVGMSSASVLESFGVVSGEASVEPAVQLTEIHYNPEGSSEDNESIEVFNAGSQDLDISDWSVNYSGIENPKDITNNGAVIESGEYAVITQDQDYSPDGVTVFQVDSFGLDNDEDEISLIYSDGQSVIDSKGHSGGCGDGKSFQRTGNYGSDWECDAPTLGEENEVSSQNE